MPPLRGALSACSLALLLLSATPLAAQPATDPDAMEAPAHVSFVEGTAILERDGQPDASPLNMPLVSGDRLRTDNGRVEILFADGSTLHLDRDTLVDFQSDDLVRLLSGRVRLAIPGAAREVHYRIDAPWASADISRPGEYRVGISAADRGDEVELAVIRGAAELVNEFGRTPLRAGERAFARDNAAPSYAYVYNSAAWDPFDRWCEERRTERLGASAEYLPESVRPYAASFTEYGSWRYDVSYGYVWYPRVVSTWRPYYHGRWVTLRPYGWTWVGYDPWAWPTHHYGRWGFSAGAWFWIPGRSWGPAWVSWAYAPGYVSWCPLGWNNRPVLQIVNIRYGRGYDPWRAWTVVPQRHFNARYVNVADAGRIRVDERVQRSFRSGTSGPSSVGRAALRDSVPIRAPGTRRSASSPLYTNLDGRDSRVGSAPSRTVVQPRGDEGGAARSRAVERSGVRGSTSSAERQSAIPGSRAGSAGTAAAPRGRPNGVQSTLPGVRSSDVEPQPRTGVTAGERQDYGRPDRIPARTASPRRGTDGSSPQSPSRTNAPADHGVGGGWAPAEDRAAPTYGRPARGRGEDAAPDGGTVGSRPMPGNTRPPQGYGRIERSTPDGYRAAPRDSAPPAAAPPRSYDAPSRGADRPSGGPPPAASRPSGGRPSGGAPPQSYGAPSRGADRPSAGAPTSGSAPSRPSAGRPSGGAPPSGGAGPRAGGGGGRGGGRPGGGR